MDEASKIVRWYGGIDPTDPVNLLSLMKAKVRLMDISQEMSMRVCKHSQEYFTNNTERKINIKRLTVSNISEGIGKAEAIAESESAELRRAESLSEGNYRGGKIVLDQTNLIIQSMIQDISYLRKEYEYERNGRE